MKLKIVFKSNSYRVFGASVNCLACECAFSARSARWECVARSFESCAVSLLLPPIQAARHLCTGRNHEVMRARLVALHRFTIEV